jgi:hypothetical protein
MNCGLAPAQPRPAQYIAPTVVGGQALAHRFPVLLISKARFHGGAWWAVTFLFMLWGQLATVGFSFTRITAAC